MKQFDPAVLRQEHENILNLIEKDLKFLDKKYRNPINKGKKAKLKNSYTWGNKRPNATGINKWKKEVIARFKGHCCECMSNKNLEVHHVFSYKYYPELRTYLNNGVCLCKKCHQNAYNGILYFEMRRYFSNLDETIKEYFKSGFGISNFNDFTSQIIKNGVEYELIETKFFKFIIYTNTLTKKGKVVKWCSVEKAMDSFREVKT